MTEIILAHGPAHKYQLAPLAQHLVCKKLNSLLPEHLSYMLLLPKRQGRQTFWYSENTIELGKVRVFSDLSQQEKSYVSGLVKELEEAVQKVASEIPELSRKIHKVCQLPSLDHILLVETPDDESYVFLYEWGHIHKERGQRVDIFETIKKKSNAKFPVFLQCHDASGSALQEQSVCVNYLGYEKAFQLDEQGRCFVGQYPRGAKLNLVFADAPQSFETSIIVSDEKEAYDIIVSATAEVYLKVFDHTGALVPSKKLLYTWDGIKHSLSVVEGKAHIPDLEVGKAIHIENEKGETLVNYTLEQEVNTIEINLQDTEAESYFFKVYNHKGETVKSLNAYVMQNNKQVALSENDEGVYYCSSREFTSGHKAELHLSKGRHTSKKKFAFEEDRNLYEFTFQPKQYTWLWWLLLIPLLILLLIPFNRELTIEISDQESKRLPNGMVNVRYATSSIFDFRSAQFFEERKVNKTQSADGEGVVLFTGLPFTLLDLIIHPARKIKVSVEPQNDCYSRDSVKTGLFSFWAKPHIRLTERTGTLVTEVLDPLSSEPIPNAKVSFLYQGERFEGISGINGKLRFKDIGVCTPLLEVEARKEGFIDDQVDSVFLANILDSNSSLKLYLTSPLECDTVFSGGHKGGLFYLYLPDPNKTYNLVYDFRSIPDRLILYKGKGDDGTVLGDYGWQGGGEIRNIRIRPETFCGGCKHISGMVEGSSDEETYWFLVLNCD